MMLGWRSDESKLNSRASSTCSAAGPPEVLVGESKLGRVASW